MRLGIGLMAFGAVATLALIGIGEQGSFAILGLGAGALAVCFSGCLIFAKSRNALAETTRFDEMADDAQSDARIHMLENRETSLVGQIASLESRRDEILAEIAAAVGGSGRATKIDLPPNLIVVPEPD
jgi:hypothetical protein